jgi:hypothetical protein
MGAHTNTEQISSRFHLGANATVAAVNAILGWVVATGAVVTSTQWSLAVVAPLCLLVGALVGAVTLAVGAGRSAIAGRVAVAVTVGAVIGELTTILLFSGSIDRRIDEQAATAAPVVMQASADLDQIRGTRVALDTDVEQARDRRDEALVVARCEYNPSPACPQTRITGVPGGGPETRTANNLLAGAQQELDAALAVRDSRAAGLDSAAVEAEQQLSQARVTAVAHADRGLGARWVAMNGYTLSNVGALLLRLAAIAFFSLLTLLPLILRLWRGQTSHDRVEIARNEADAAIAIRQAEVRTAAETLWAEQQLTNARFAVAAQNEIDLDYHRRRVADATGTPLVPRRIERVEEDMYLPIAAEAEAASRITAELPTGTTNLPAEVKPADKRPALIPTIPDVTKAAARFIRPLVPPIVARVIDTATQPVRAARQAFEEVEEITFSFKRVHRVTVDSEERAGGPTVTVETPKPVDWDRVDATFDRPRDATGHVGRPQLRTSGADRRLSGAERGRELASADRGELQAAEGPLALPPSE